MQTIFGTRSEGLKIAIKDLLKAAGPAADLTEEA